MTCIVAYTNGKSVWMGADSAGIDEDYNRRVRGDVKVFTIGPFILGFCGSFRMGQLLHWNLQVKPQTADQTDEQYMSTVFVDAVREALLQGGYARKENNVEEGGNFLVGYRGNIYSVESDFQIGLCTLSYESVGSGAHYAMGALDVLIEDLSSKPKDLLIRALETAERYNAGVCSPFVVLKGGST